MAVSSRPRVVLGGASSGGVLLSSAERTSSVVSGTAADALTLPPPPPVVVVAVAAAGAVAAAVVVVGTSGGSNGDEPPSSARTGPLEATAADGWGFGTPLPAGLPSPSSHPTPAAASSAAASLPEEAPLVADSDSRGRGEATSAQPRLVPLGEYKFGSGVLGNDAGDVPGRVAGDFVSDRGGEEKFEGLSRRGKADAGFVLGAVCRKGVGGVIVETGSGRWMCIGCGR